MSVKLNKSLLEDEKLSPSSIAKSPSKESFSYPEKVLQFGTGVLLRGLPNYFINKGNQERTFKGRVVVVKTTSSAGADSFANQNGLFTQIIEGIENGQMVQKAVINNSISRVLSASESWNQILEFAASPELEIILSNTTEVGISYVPDNIAAIPPQSFPGKLASCLFNRYLKNGKTEAPGLIVIPTELIVDNGQKLKDLVIRQAQENQLPEAFLDWLNSNIAFCSSLVDRIVPGKPSEDECKTWEEKLGYQDDLLISSEVYRLWAIEGDDRIKETLSFYKSDSGVVIEPDITRYRERKLRLLNGVHTLSVGLGFLCGFNTVKEMMEAPPMYSFIESMALKEMAPLVKGVSSNEAQIFSMEVLDRFKNPFIVHKLLSITLQYTSKMAMRNIPLFEAASNSGVPTPLMNLGFAAYLLFMKGKEESGQIYGYRNNQAYWIQDDSASLVSSYWNNYATSPSILVKAILSDTKLWGKDLSSNQNLISGITKSLELLLSQGPVNALNQTLN